MERIGIDLGGTKIEIAVLDARRHARSLRRRVPTPAGDYAATVEAIAHTRGRRRARARRAAAPSASPCPARSRSPPGCVKNANSTCLIGRPFKRGPRGAPRAGGAPRQRRQLLRALGSGRRRGERRRRRLRRDPGHRRGRRDRGRRPRPHRRERHRRRVGPRADAARPGRSRARAALLLRARRMRRDLPLRPRARRGPRARLGRANSTLRRSRAARPPATPPARRRWRRYEARLARALAVVINIVDPDVIVLGGGLSNLARLYERVPAPLGRACLLRRGAHAPRPAACMATRAACAARRGSGGRRERRSRLARAASGAPRRVDGPVRPHRLGAEGPPHLGARGGARP